MDTQLQHSRCLRQQHLNKPSVLDSQKVVHQANSDRSLGRENFQDPIQLSLLDVLLLGSRYMLETNSTWSRHPEYHRVAKSPEQKSNLLGA